jgi:hypothetical protein
MHAKISIFRICYELKLKLDIHINKTLKLSFNKEK